MKILIVMAGFFPGKEYGGPPVSVDNFCSLMKEDCFIVTHNHDKGDTSVYEGIDSGVWVKRDNCSVMYLPNDNYNKASFEQIIKELNPDLLYLQGLFQQCVLPCLKLAKKYNIDVLLAPRGELCAGAFKKKYKKIPYIIYLRAMGLIKNVEFQSTSDEETEAIQKILKVKEKRVHFLTNIPSIPKKEYERTVKISGKGKFIFLSRIHPKKNLISAIKYFSVVNGEAVFDIYGPIEDESYWKECQIEIEKLPQNVTVNYCGLVSHDEVHEVFSKHDAFLFPTFSENYGHVIAESLVVGTPVIISDQTPWNDVETHKCGWAIPLSKPENFTRRIQEIVNIEEPDYRKMSDSAIDYAYRKSNFAYLKESYNKALSRVCIKECEEKKK